MSLPPESTNRVLIKVTLEPVVGSTIQPTGFPDLGAAEFDRPGPEGTTRCLLVESVQSMTNHLEAKAWDAPAHKPSAPIEQLPYVAVEDARDSSFLTSSRLEPHRLASPYIKDALVDGEPGKEWITSRLGLVERRPTDWARVYSAIFEMDPMCLIHGAFFSDPAWAKSGNPKVRRATTAVIEARNVERVVSGGLKRDDVQFTGDKDSGRGSEEGYGFVPFGRVEYAAEVIELAIALDVGQIRGYGLGAEPTQLLENVALWQIAKLLEEPLRLRTACDLEVAEARVERPEGFELAQASAYAEAIASAGVEFDGPGARTAQWPAPKGKKAKKD